MLLRATLLVAAFVSLGSAAVSAQQSPMQQQSSPQQQPPKSTPAQMRTPRNMHLAAMNQTGVLEYCKDHGWIKDATMDAQKKLIAALPVPADASGSDDAEKLGRQGTISAFGSKPVTVDEFAKAHGLTTQVLCTRMGDHVDAAEAQWVAQSEDATHPAKTVPPANTASPANKTSPANTTPAKP